MIRKLFILLMIGSCLSCHKKSVQQSGCDAQVCTTLFAIIGIHFTDKNGTAIVVQNYTAVNQRTHLNMVNSNPPANPFGIGYYIVADDSAKSQLSTEGDEVLVSATNPATNQTKTTMFKITGGCKCHVEKVLGVDTLAFD
ncbi:hypothetical protein [Mucilaginibacter sp. UR6-11]|uniref:hypothetical protein n=1 Tax=Mucilaginibacter sp. UR6-11 TaxID=1435644 RepID=UPI001E5BA5A6|nr:hypothetical protein [Mucilaginibacter sp. UR6-11]MCC8423379.1 hypothetical protein [Mucilaginibacter sp. UR6-11]